MILQNKIKSLVSKAFGTGEISRDGINYAVKCPECGDAKKNKKKLIVRLDDGRYHCWICGIKGKSVSYLVRKHRPELAGLIPDAKRVKKNDSETEESISLPKDFVPLFSYSGKDPDILSAINYAKSRNVSDIDLARWRMLSCKSGSYRRRVIFPSFDKDGNLNYYVARAIDNTAKPKYRNAKGKKNNIIFNEIDIDWTKPVILVEGIFDAIKSPENAIPILGSSISQNSELYKKLVSNLCTVYLSLDPDMKEKAFLIAQRLCRAGCEVYMSFAPQGKDLADLDRASVRHIIVNSFWFDDRVNLYHKIGKIKSGSVF